MKVAIIDYGSGNLRSAAKAFQKVASGEVQVTSNSSDLAYATHIILPGVGAFGDCMNGLKSLKGMVEAMEKEVLVKKKPFLGICVGMQLLADEGHEFGVHKGLGWVGGIVRRFEEKGHKIPHIGWNNVMAQKQDGKLFLEIDQDSDFYFVHSYILEAKDKGDVLATCDYGEKFSAVVGKGNIFGTQFHPEKSQKNGLKLIENFLKVNSNSESIV